MRIVDTGIGVEPTMLGGIFEAFTKRAASSVPQDAVNRLRNYRGMPPQPSIAITGFGRESDLEMSRKSGFLRHLTKPVAFRALERAICEVMTEADPSTAA